MNMPEPIITILKTIEVVDQDGTGAALRKWRESVGVTMSVVAERMGVSIPYVSDLERGNRNWNMDILSRYREAVREGK